MNKERLREMALEIATAARYSGVMMAHGKPIAEAEIDYQAAVRAFDAALVLFDEPARLPDEDPPPMPEGTNEYPF